MQVFILSLGFRFNPLLRLSPSFFSFDRFPHFDLVERLRVHGSGVITGDTFTAVVILSDT